MYIELSYVMGSHMPVYPDNPQEQLEPVSQQSKGDGGNTSLIRHFSHNGTHLDTPYHFDSGGKRIHELPVEDFIYEHPALVEIPKGYNEEITKGDLAHHDLSGVDALLIRTGFDEVREKEPAAYRIAYPGFTGEAARYLRNEVPSLKVVMIDFMSADSFLGGNRDNFPAHHEFLCASTSTLRPLLLVEDVNLKPVTGKRLRRVFALPIRFEGCDAAPVSVVAEIF